LNPVVELARAMDFAAHKHSTQRRKGIKAESYVVHLTEVARLLAEATDGADPALVMAGLLHDTVEDTATTESELSAAFGDDVTSLVLQVTDDKTLDKDERKMLQIQTAPGKSERARMLKIADKIANLRSIRESPPLGWTAHRKAEYVAWAREVVAACGRVNPRLEKLFEEAASALEQGLPSA
jgi:GTP diphosphokinase / guanosine-3',5'-bis(diphosphate) 3'-diphosphatase